MLTSWIFLRSALGINIVAVVGRLDYDAEGGGLSWRLSRILRSRGD